MRSPRCSPRRFGCCAFLPELHTAAEDRWFIANVILKNCEVIVAEDDSGIVSFLSLQGEEVRLLYTRPDRIGEGAGTQLIEAAKKSGVGALELWCFQANARARRFYEARGFFAIRFTDGEENEEKTPDIRYRWGTWRGPLTVALGGWPVCIQGGLWRVCATSTSVCPRRSQVTEANAPSHEPVAANTT